MAFLYTSWKHCYVTAQYTSALRYPLHMRVQVYRTRAITSVVYGRNAENEPVSRIKMADYSIIIIHTNKGAEMKRSI